MFEYIEHRHGVEAFRFEGQFENTSMDKRCTGRELFGHVKARTVHVDRSDSAGAMPERVALKPADAGAYVEEVRPWRIEQLSATASAPPQHEL